MLKTVLSMLVILPLLALAAGPASIKTSDDSNFQIRVPESVPFGDFTPHGYIDNPHHSMIFNRSGVIRSYPPLGFGFWKREFSGSYAAGPRGHVNYLSLLQMSVNMDGKSLATTKDFKEQDIDVVSACHTKHVMSYDWTYKQMDFSFTYYLADENALVCLVSIRNLSGRDRKITLHSSTIYGDWELEWWGSNGLSQKFIEEKNASVQKIWAYGDVFIMGSDWQAQAAKATGDRETWETWIRENDMSWSKECNIKGKGPLYSTHSFQVLLPPKSVRHGMIVLCRGKNEDWTLNTYDRIQKKASAILQDQLARDDKFWSQCPQLGGDWPEAWRHGWVYDWETLRMNVRPPIGIFKHPWDAMQVHSPRLVLGETALDMFTMSYADPQLAAEVIFGTFADAIAPNVPCVREDGSVNMIGADGSECGTAPMWGFPYHVIRSVYIATGDSTWINNLYPYLKRYIQWWMQNRTDQEGWFHCNNSWESGQDGSRRFLVEGEGDPATFVRTVDVEASMAEAMQNMTTFAGIAGVPEDIAYWQELAQERVRHTHSMFVDGWFRDIDGRNGQPILFDNFYDPIMLAPLTCNVATEEQIRDIKPKISYIAENLLWLQWPPGVMAFTEAAWTADAQAFAARAIRQIADRIYARTDSRDLLFSDKNDPFAYRIPGIANEFWPLKERPAGSENYGWGAILPLFIIRNIIGFREKDESVFYLAPCLPQDYLQPGRSYEISNLKYRKNSFDLSYNIHKDGQITAQIRMHALENRSVRILQADGTELIKTRNRQQPGRIEFSVRNGERYLVEIIHSCPK